MIQHKTPSDPDAMVVAQSLTVARRAQEWERLIAIAKAGLRSGPRDDRLIVEIFRNGAMALRALRRARTIKRLARHLQWRYARGLMPVRLYINLMRALHVRAPLAGVASTVRDHRDGNVHLAFVESLVEMARLGDALSLAAEFNVPLTRLSAPNRKILVHFRNRSKTFDQTGERGYLDDVIAGLLQRYPQKAAPKSPVAGPIRILILSSTLGVGGSERQLLHLLAQLDRQPTLYEVLLVVSHRRRAELPLGSLANVKIKYRDDLEQADPDELSKLTQDVVLKDIELLLRRPRFKPLLRLAARFKPHVVYNAVGLSSTDAVLAGLLTSARDIVVRFGGLGFEPSDDGSDEFQVLQAVTARTSALAASRITFVANSRAAQRIWATRLGLPQATINVIPNGTAFGDILMPAERRAKKAALFGRSDVTVIGYVGRFIDLKRPDLWVRTALGLARHHNGLRFLMIGEGPLRGTIQKRLAGSPHGSQFTFTGNVLDGMNALYQAMDVLLVTSSSESFSNVVVEALGHGTYVVSSDVGDSADIIRDPLLGRVVPPDREDDFLATMQDVVRHIGEISMNRGLRAIDTSKRLGIAKMWASYARLFPQPRDGTIRRQCRPPLSAASPLA